MATTLTTSTFSATYRDDYRDSDNYHRILFNSGRALQARELTQMQTILQKQIERFGNNIYREGAYIKPGGASAGEVTLNNRYEYIKLNEGTYPLPADPSVLVGSYFLGNNSQVLVKVVQVVEAVGSDPATLYVQYVSSFNSSAVTSSPRRVEAGEILLQTYGGSDTLQVATGTGVTGQGSQIIVGEGIFYVKGNFVFALGQSLIVSKYTNSPTLEVGYRVAEEVYTTADDDALYDNQGALPNTAAPGADRYKITLTLATRTSLESDENFVSLINIRSGVIISSVFTNDQYRIPNDLIAERIKDNSGDYIIKPFTARFIGDSDEDYLRLVVSDGSAVVEGYKSQITSNSIIRVPKPTDTIDLANELIAINYGNYVIVEPSAVKGLPNINTLELMNIRNATDYGGSTIGTCRVRAVHEDGSNYRYYLFDIRMNVGSDFRDGKSIGTSSTNYFNPTLNSGVLERYDVTSNRLLFPLNRPRAEEITNISLTRQKKFGPQSFTSNQLTLTPASNETFVNAGDWIFAEQDSAIYTGSKTISITSGLGGQATITFTDWASGDAEAITYVRTTGSTVRSKTLTTRFVERAVESDGNGFAYIDLRRADIFDIIHIADPADSDLSYTNRFVLDNGQRDNFYGVGKAVLKTNSIAPAGNLKVTYRYFTHGATGEFFAANSYAGTIAYNEIPNFRTASGIIINLRDYLDFRSVMDSNGEFTSGQVINLLPQPTDVVEADISYYLPRKDRLTLTTDNRLRYIIGSSGSKPKLPPVPEKTLVLYNVEMNPNTLNRKDLKIQKIEKKRFTMADIAQLERRINRLEEITALSLLELDTNQYSVLDSDGNDRFKSGFVVDNFSTQLISSLSSSDYRASIDPYRQLLLPRFNEGNIKLLFDSDNAQTTLVRRGDYAMLPYTTELYIDQSKASSSVQINPFEVVTFNGRVELSPASDEWRDVNSQAVKAIEGNTSLGVFQNTLFNNWAWNWSGIDTTNLLPVATASKVIRDTTGTPVITSLNSVISDEVLTVAIENKYLNVALIPKIRSRKIYFKVTGLKPFTEVFAFFDGISVADWVREEAFVNYSEITEDPSNLYANATQHPDTPSALITDGSGSLEGSFLIPNTSAISFGTGSITLTFLDIDVFDETSATCIAQATYAATGYVITAPGASRPAPPTSSGSNNPAAVGGGGGGGSGEDDDRPGSGGNWNLGPDGGADDFDAGGWDYTGFEEAFADLENTGLGVSTPVDTSNWSVGAGAIDTRVDGVPVGGGFEPEIDNDDGDDDHGGGGGGWGDDRDNEGGNIGF